MRPPADPHHRDRPVPDGPEDREPAAVGDRLADGGGHRFIRLLGRAHAESRPAVRELLAGQHVEVVERFRAALVRAGVATSAIQTAGRGENDNLVPTPDGAREPRNRRVEIAIR